MTKRLAIIDGKSVFYRGYYAMPNLSTADGTPTGGVFGFASLAIELIKKLEPDYVAVAWDKPKTNIRKRLEIYPEYKAGRKPAPADFYEQIPILHELLDAFGWPMYEIDDYEADDIMGAFAREAEAKGVETCLLTSDLDALQLISPLTKVYALKSGLANIEEFDVKAFEQKYGIKVNQFLDLKSLKGDSSDNLPGVPGIGEKTALSLLKEFGSLENIYQNLDVIKPSVAKKLEAGKELAFITKKVATIWVDAPVSLDWGIADVDDTDLEKVASILKRLEFNSLVRRLPAYMRPEPEQRTLYFDQSEALGVEVRPWPDTLVIDGYSILYYESGDLYLMTGGGAAYRESVKKLDQSAIRVLELSKVVSYDIKQLYHDLMQHGIEAHFQDVHDIRQAAFLIEPLRRDRSIAALIGEEIKTPREMLISLARLYKWQETAFKHVPEVAKIAYEFDFPVIYPLFMMEHRGIKINKDIFSKMSNQFDDEYKKLEQEIYQLVGAEFNIGSPAQLSDILFTKLQLPTAGIRHGKTGYSTDQKTLDKLNGRHPIIELVEKTRELAKLKNTYIDTLPGEADINGRVHTTFLQDVASTGRLASLKPNLQNIPVRSELGRKIRDAFIPAKGKVFVSADYSQFELRLAAVLAGDEELINDFNNGVDIHTKTASDVYGVPIDEVTKDQRRDAKVINFGVLYGMSPHGLADATGMSFAEAKRFIDQYFILRSPIRKFIDDILHKARTEGYVETYYGRRRPTPDILSSNYMVRSSAERATANLPIQGTEADLMKRAMMQLEIALDGIGEPILQIHDSILVEAPKANTLEVEKIMRQIMEAVAPELRIKLQVDVSIGDKWGEL